MKNNNSSFSSNTHNQFVVSYELLSLLQWMVIHETPKLKKIITRALKSGLKKEIQRPDFKNSVNAQAHNNVIEFFGLLESLIQESINEQAIERVLEKDLMPAIDHIDSTACDDDIVRSSIEKVSAHLEINPHENPQDALFRELLKQWKPGKKTIMN